MNIPPNVKLEFYRAQLEQATQMHKRYKENGHELASTTGVNHA